MLIKFIFLCSSLKFDTNTLFNVFGIFLILIGTYFIYNFSQKNIHKIDGGNPSTDYTALEKNAKRHNNLMKFGFLIILVGTIIQVIILFC